MTQPGEIAKPFMFQQYREKLISFSLIGIFVFGMLLSVVLFFSTDQKIAYLTSLIILFFSLLNSYSFSLEVSGSEIVYSYGIGLFSRSIYFNQIDRCDIEPNTYLRSWIYNPKGEDALILYVRGGQVLRLPARRPKKIVEMLKTKI